MSSATSNRAALMSRRLGPTTRPGPRQSYTYASTHMSRPPSDAGPWVHVPYTAPSSRPQPHNHGSDPPSTTVSRECTRDRHRARLPPPPVRLTFPAAAVAPGVSRFDVCDYSALRVRATVILSTIFPKQLHHSTPPSRLLHPCRGPPSSVC